MDRQTICSDDIRQLSLENKIKYSNAKLAVRSAERDRILNWMKRDEKETSKVEPVASLRHGFGGGSGGFVLKRKSHETIKQAKS